MRRCGGPHGEKRSCRHAADIFVRVAKRFGEGTSLWGCSGAYG